MNRVGKPTTTQYVIWNMSGRELRTASEIHNLVDWNFRRFSTPQHVSLATVSGILHRLVRSGDVYRVKGFGPRGGHGYVLSKKGLEKR